MINSYYIYDYNHIFMNVQKARVGDACFLSVSAGLAQAYKMIMMIIM